MEQPAPTYEGEEPFVFVSYSHQDEALVYREIQWLQDQGIHVWYDTTGIGLGNEWSDEIAKAIQGAARFVYFITPRSVASEHCRRELNFAQAEGRSVMAVHLEPTEVQPGLRLSLDNRQAIFKFRLDEDDYRAALMNSLTLAPSGTSVVSTTSKQERKRRSWLALGAIAMLVSIALGWIVLRDMVTLSNMTDGKSLSTPTENVTTNDPPGASTLDRPVHLGGTSNTQARSHYLLAEQLVETDPERALKELESAVEIDSEYAQAWILMSFVYGSISRNPASTETALVGMSTAAARAVAAAPDYWEAHIALWNYLGARRDWVGSDRAFQKAVELAKVAEVVMPRYFAYLWQNGRHIERQQFIESSDDLDLLLESARNLYFLGRKEQALAELERMRGVGGTAWSDALDRELAIERGDVEELDELLFAGTDFEGLWGTEAFLDVLRRKLASESVPPRGLFARYAIYAASHGDIDLALEFLRGEYIRDGYGSKYLIWHPSLANVRASEGFKTFLRDYGLVAMFQTSGKWNDYCRPVGVDDFECH